MCYVYCHHCTIALLYTPSEIEKAKLILLPENPKRDFREMKKCPDCKANNARSKWFREIGQIPDELIDLTIAERACINPFAPVVKYCINSKG